METDFSDFETWPEMREFIQKQIDGNFTAESNALTSLHLLLQLNDALEMHLDKIYYKLQRVMEVAAGPR